MTAAAVSGTVPSLGERVGSFLRSPQFTDVPAHALTDYWRFEQGKVSISVEGGELSASGDSGFYAPTAAAQARPPSTWLRRLRNFAADPIGYPRIIAGEIARRVSERLDVERQFVRRFPLRLANVGYATAFDAVMARHPEADVDLSATRIDFDKLAQVPGCQATAAAVAADYVALSRGVAPNEQIYRAYYLKNILAYAGAFGDDFSFLEIGAGNGNLAHLMLQRASRTSYIVDLPGVICGAVSYLTRMMPGMRFLLPNEADGAPHDDVQLVFLTPAQLDRVADGSVALAVNCASFQEMTPTQVADYFALVDRAVRPGGLFLCYNRVEKIPGDETILQKSSSAAVMRFAEYPWRPGREAVVHEVCRFARLVQRDNCVLRVERLPVASS
jgi:putative sugar O-methyltransferase